jgi:hypothetical protein
MPYITGSDEKGSFIKGELSGKKYYYDPDDVNSRRAAKKKAQEQAGAIQASQSKRGKKK